MTPEAGLLALCVGGPKHGLLVRQTNGINSFIHEERYIEGGIGGLETPTLSVLYTLRHVAVPGRTFHVWQAANGDTEDHRFRDSVRTLIEAFASERAAVQCLSLHDCQLTHDGEVVR